MMPFMRQRTRNICCVCVLGSCDYRFKTTGIYVCVCTNVGSKTNSDAVAADENNMSAADVGDEHFLTSFLNVELDS